MAGLDKGIRNALRNATSAMRRALETDYARQLEGRFAIDPDGTIHRDARLDHLDLAGRIQRDRVVEALDHRIAGGLPPREAVTRFVREAAFSSLNRLAALKLMEAPERGLIPPSVGSGDRSSGFTQFKQLSPAALATQPDGGYRLYLELLFDDLAREIGVLFDRDRPHTALFPEPGTLATVLDQLNQPSLAGVWGEDETIGWIYQYFTPKEQRDAARKASAAPRDGYELAFRNQFFTPRYVVEFLGDNTLGRTWYEMRRGETTLADRPYFVRRKHTIWLNPGQEVPPPYDPQRDGSGWMRDDDDALWTRPHPDPETACAYAHTIDGYAVARRLVADRSSLSNPNQAAAVVHREVFDRYASSGSFSGTFGELRVAQFFAYRADRHGGGIADDPFFDELHAAICHRWDLEAEVIPYRPKKDPRHLRVLDPASGSCHFLLYAFDLLLTIYDEAYDDPDPALGPRLQALWPDRAAFRRVVPELILRHNLHGVDIDLRCVQIGQLALWLRAQRAWQEQGIRPADRPPVGTVQVVGAEPLPGDRGMLADFLRTLDNPAIEGMVTQVWEELRHVDEIGSLLKADGLVHTLVKEAKRTYQSGAAWEPTTLFGDGPPRQRRISFDFIADEEFWESAEQTVFAALRHYADAATSAGEHYRRGLFADNAARGFAFLELFAKPFDVVLMNPPFGAATRGTRAWLESNYTRSKFDIYAAFVERGIDLLCTNGFLGSISSRTCFFLKSFFAWRTEVVLDACRVHAFADLGQGVLDTAAVETAAYVLEKQ